MGPARRPRLQGLKNNPPKRQHRPAQNAKSADGDKKTCPSCGSTDIETIESLSVCKGCYTEISNANIENNVEFGEASNGRATVQGGSVGDNARHAKTMGAPALRKIGGGDSTRAADVAAQAKRILGGLCPRLGVAEDVQGQAQQIWVLASGVQFSTGRRTDEVAAACLYAACRRQKDNSVMLMDIAELVKVGVFRIAEVYKDLCKKLYLNNESVGTQRLQELEPLIKKYCDKLQFGEKTKIVAEDALKIIRRMNRDWIVAGRHPAGLCGACIILAARMNNFQRSVREVVYVSKVADVTIAKRVEEFRRTKSAGLSVDQFRQYANKIKHQHDPPSLYLSDYKDEMMQKRRKKREDHMRLRESQERQSQQPGGPIEIPDDATDASSRLSSMEPEYQIGSQTNGQGQTQTQAGTSSPGNWGQVPTPPVTQAVSRSTSTHEQNSPGAAPAQSTRKRKSSEPDEHDDTSALAVGGEDGPSQKRQRTNESLPREDSQTPGPSTQQSTKRKRQDEPDAAARSEFNVEGPAEKRQRTVEPSPAPSQQPVDPAIRYDADGFAIPALPPRAESIETDDFSPPKRGRGRPKKEDRPPEIDISQEELDVEDYLEKQIEKALEDGEVEENRGHVENDKREEEEKEALERAQTLSDEQKKLEAARLREKRDAAGLDYWNPDADDLALEFENDPEVQNCILKPDEVIIKERIWVAHNEDWLRKQAEKEMMAQVAKATNSGRKKSEKGGKRKKRGKMGDGTVLTESSTPIETPVDAARAMLNKRAPQKSGYIDFSALDRIYALTTPSSSRAGSATPNEGGAQSRDVTPAPSRAASIAPAPSEDSTASPGAEAEDQEAEANEDGNGEQEAVDAFGDDINENPDDEDEINVDDEWKTALKQSNVVEEDEYGAVYDGYDDEGDEYE